MADLNTAYGPLLDSNQNAHRSFPEIAPSLHQQLHMRNEPITYVDTAVMEINTTFSPETIKARECVGRYKEVANIITKIDIQLNNWNVNKQTIDKYMEQLLVLQNNHIEISKLLNIQYESNESDENEAKDTYPLKEMSDVLANYIETIKGASKSWDVYKQAEILKLEAKLTECNEECNVLREFFATGIRELNSNLNAEANVNLCSICFTNSVDTAISCGHTFCKVCIDKLVPVASPINRRNCPTCRKPILDVIKLYFS